MNLNKAKSSRPKTIDFEAKLQAREANLEFELANYIVTVQHVNYDAMGTPITSWLSKRIFYTDE